MGSIEERLGEVFINRPYNENELITYLQDSKYKDIQFLNNEQASKGYKFTSVNVFHMKFYNDDRTLFVGFDNDGKVIHFKVENSKLDTYPPINYAAGIGCWLGVLVIVTLVIWMLFSFISGALDTWNEEEEFNPYTEDYDGDGLNGDQDDHDILHEMPTMPTKPMEE